MKNITDAEVKGLIQGTSKLLVIDLWANWCGPCRSLGPKLEELNKENSATTEIVKLDVDENPETPSEYHVRGIPTVLFFKEGQLVDTLVGNQPKEQIQAVIDKHTK
jgi:thioredoxin 1